MSNACAAHTTKNGEESVILATGGASFIGANFILEWLRYHDEPVVNLDKPAYAGNLENLAELSDDPRHVFIKGDIADQSLLEGLLKEHQLRVIINFAAESHVDRSIHDPDKYC